MHLWEGGSLPFETQDSTGLKMSSLLSPFPVTNGMGPAEP